MKKNSKITESDINRLVEKILVEQKIEEGLGDVFQGLKGAWRGEGYDYFKYLNQLKSLTKRLKKLDEPNTKIMIELESLKNKISNSKMPDNKKNNLISHIDAAKNHFSQYSSYIDAIINAAEVKLK